MSLRARVLLMITASLWVARAVASDDFEAELAGIQQAWAVVQYETSGKAAQQSAFDALCLRAHTFSSAYPQRAEALLWEGIVLSTYAQAKGGLRALGIAKKARSVLERALQLDATVLQGGVYTALGALYGKVPGFPAGFGNDKTARQYLLKALELNPTGIDANYFYADFLIDEKEYDQAFAYLQKALAAPARPGRELADEGRRKEISVLLARLAQRR